MKKKALKLAEIFEEVGRAKYPYHLDAAEMLRKLVEELDKQGESVDDKTLQETQAQKFWEVLKRNWIK